MKSAFLWLASAGALVFPQAICRAQSAPVSGLYQIVSGSFVACCGIGGEFHYSLPREDQGFVSLTVDPATILVSMSLLGQDRQTVYTLPGFGQTRDFAFSFGVGHVSAGAVEFLGLPSDPRQPSYQYVASYTADTLQIHGEAIVPCLGCADLPTAFSHTNVLATLVTPPLRLEGLERAGANFSFRFTGEPGYDYFVEFSEAWPGTSWKPLTNYRAKLETIHPVVTDSLSNAPARFYRVRKEDCRCD